MELWGLGSLWQGASTNIGQTIGTIGGIFGEKSGANDKNRDLQLTLQQNELASKQKRTQQYVLIAVLLVVVVVAVVALKRK